MRNNQQFIQVKKAAVELVEFSDREDLLILLQAALSSEECKCFDHEETGEYFKAVQSTYIFLQDLAALFGFDTKVFPAGFKNRIEYLDYKFNQATNAQVIDLISQLFSKVPARKLVWDIQSVFTSAIDSEQFSKDRKLYAGISFSLKLITRFLNDYELLVSFNVQERICNDLADFFPIEAN